MKELVINSKKVEEKLIRFIKDELKSRGFKKAVFGLSGGIDSTLVAFLLKKALGAKNVRAIFLPYKSTDKESGRNFRKVVKLLNIKSRVIPITPAVDCYFKRFPKADRVRRGNKMARERMSVLYDQSRVEGALVIGSGNKTEALLGYCTHFGDSACAINPIGGLYKTQVRQLARRMGVPQHIVDRPPTADLWPDQTDEGELGLSYEQMDAILHFAVGKGYKPSRLAKKGYSRASIKKILDRVEAFRYKRELPAIAKIK